VASKFQNRLVGTIIIVALGVIVLPGLLDGKKKHYQDNFASIPLVPKPGDTDESEASPQASQSLPSQPPEGAGAAIEQADNVPADEDTPAVGNNNSATAAAPKESAPARREPVKTAPPRAELIKPPAVREQAKSAPVKSTEQTKPTAKLPLVKPDVKPPAKPAVPRSEALAQDKPAPTPKPAPSASETAETPPQGQAWVVQLGALKNAAKVTEIVGKLRLAGYRAYTVPSAPVAGQITRIFVGPDASKQKLESALPEMNQLSGLSGQLRSYQAR